MAKNNSSLLFFLLSLLLLASCSTTSTKNIGSNSFHSARYCDSYLAYQMCVSDIDDDGLADLMYFQDTNEIFMLSPEYEGVAIAGLSVHRCLQSMDPAIRQASSRLLDINAGASSLHKAQLKSQLMLSYMRYLPTINSCMKDHHVANSSPDEVEFGDEDFDEL